ncbi:hypothetical protein AMQ84_05660 [Paenibacillus riograndensis]|uniref:Uncharacterized protein n=1 Tax=Paenibacillus riograndensis TaxID=483937 RepID=A0A132U8E1_9BACL|nr:hypothetical protein [Paenibacillus riograndensis]KWX79897.1 hypothetical protein AMQ84_05660 [Paenibacillus riograndensis]
MDEFVTNSGRNAVVEEPKAGLAINNGRNTVVRVAKVGLAINSGRYTVVEAAGSVWPYPENYKAEESAALDFLIPTSACSPASSQALVGKRELIFPKIKKS